MWNAVNSGATKGQRGSEGGVILADDEHPLGARITLEQGGITAPFAITCGIHGWMVHTRFFRQEAEAAEAFDSMKVVLAEILATVPAADDPEVEKKAADVSDAVGAFIQRFP